MKKRKQEYKREEIIFRCDCGSEALVVTAFQWEENDPVDIDISFWKRGHDIPYTLKEKIRAIKYILKYGHPYYDMVSMDIETATKFANAVLDACKNPEKDN